jgi:hypothetical protein
MRVDKHELLLTICHVLVTVRTDLPIPAETAQALALKPALLRHVLWPLLAMRGEVPDGVHEGQEISVRLWFLGVLPAWRHTLRLVAVRPGEISSREQGGPVRAWNHRLTFERLADGRCAYTDQVEVQAGALTPLVAAFAQLIYRWRQRRWRSLARVLA